MPPILPLIIQPLIEHLHHLDKLVLTIRHLRNLIHLCSTRTPGVIGCRPADFDLGVGVAFGVVFGYADGSSAAGGQKRWGCLVLSRGQVEQSGNGFERLTGG